MIMTTYKMRTKQKVKNNSKILIKIIKKAQIIKRNKVLIMKN